MSLKETFRRQRRSCCCYSSSSIAVSISFSNCMNMFQLFVICLILTTPSRDYRNNLNGMVNGQQIATIQVPQFSTNVTYRQDVCDRYKLHAEGKLDLRDALEGLQLHPIIRLNQFFRLDEKRAIDKTNPGLVALILDEIARRGQFQWRNSFAVAGRPEGDKSFTDLLVWGADHYDVFCSWWDITLERLQKGVAFPEGWNDGSYILVGRDETLIAEQQKKNGGLSSIDLWNWLAPFDTMVWLLTAFTVIVSGILYHWLDHLELNPTITKQSKSYDHPKLRWTACYNSFLTFTQHYLFEPRSHSARLLSVSLAFWSMLVAATYTANLASHFVVNNVPTLQIDSIESAIKYGRVICLWEGAAIDDYITTEYENAYIIRKQTEIETYDAVTNGECDFVVAQFSTWQRLESDKEVNTDCNLIQVGRTIKHLKAGFATVGDAGTLCTSLIRDVLNVHLVEMQDDGFLDLAWESYLRKEQDLDCELERELQLENVNEETASLGLHEMAGTFFIHWFFIVISILCALSAKIYNKYYLKNNKNKNNDNDDDDDDDDNNNNNTTITDQEQARYKMTPTTTTTIMNGGTTNTNTTNSNSNNNYFTNTGTSLKDIKKLPMDLQVNTLWEEQGIQSMRQQEMAKMQISLLNNQNHLMENQEKLIYQQKLQMQHMNTLLKSLQVSNQLQQVSTLHSNNNNLSAIDNDHDLSYFDASETNSTSY